MNVYSLFDGGSCGYQALKDAGIKVDKYYELSFGLQRYR